MAVQLAPAVRAVTVPASPPPPTTFARAQAVDILNFAEDREEVARKGEKMTLVSTSIVAPLAAGGVAIGFAAASAPLLGGVLATGGALLLVALIGLLIYLLVFRHNEAEAHKSHLAAEQTLQAAVPMVVVPDPTPTPPAPGTVVQTLPKKPPYVQTPNAKQIALDKVMAQAKYAYALVDAEHAPIIDSAGKPISVHVAPGFRMVDGINQPTPKEAIAMITAALKDAGMWQPTLAAGLGRLSIGRASLTEISEITQLLIRAKGIAPETRFKNPLAYWAAVRELQWQYGIGLDCAGYVSEAIAAISAGGFADPQLDGVFNNGNAFMPEVDSRFKLLSKDSMPANLAAGDLVALKDPSGDVGHFLMTYEAHDLTDADKAYYASSIVDPNGVLAGGPVRLYVFDSSWGAGGDPTQPQAGVSRHVLFFNSATQQWSQLITSRGQTTPYVSTTDGPYNHIIIGVYRYGR